MAITIGGIKITQVNLAVNSEGRLDLTGNYQLESNTGIVLAKQAFNGYQDIKLNPTPATLKLMGDLHAALKADLQATLGLE